MIKLNIFKILDDGEMVLTDIENYVKICLTKGGMRFWIVVFDRLDKSFMKRVMKEHNRKVIPYPLKSVLKWHRQTMDVARRLQGLPKIRVKGEDNKMVIYFNTNLKKFVDDHNLDEQVEKMEL